MPPSAASSEVSDHPRIRGEHRIEPDQAGGAAGSSPHTRGAQPVALGQVQRRRIIPAYAGSTVPVSVTPVSRWDHPRIRGEHSKSPGGFFHLVGSSPHTRGARGRPRVYPISSRIIPAYAGSTIKLVTESTMYWDHPRIRGEHADQVAKTKFGKGSSPHTRGALAGASPTPWSRGIIPAYAGSTRAAAPRITRIEDHPRIRGEHPSSEFETYHDGGSSPHTRGALKMTIRAFLNARIIPAYAGST